MVDKLANTLAKVKKEKLVETLVDTLAELGPMTLGETL